MAKSSYGPRAVSAWTVKQKPAARTRVVRLGRPANDNIAKTPPLRRLLNFAVVGGLAALALRYFGAI